MVQFLTICLASVLFIQTKFGDAQSGNNSTLNDNDRCASESNEKLHALPGDAVELPNYEAVLPSGREGFITLPCSADRRVCLLYCIAQPDCRFVMFQSWGAPAGLCLGIPIGVHALFKRTNTAGTWLVTAHTKSMTVLGNFDLPGGDLEINARNPVAGSGGNLYVDMPVEERVNCQKLCSFRADCTVAMHNSAWNGCYLKNKLRNEVATGKLRVEIAYLAVQSSYM